MGYEIPMESPCCGPCFLIGTADKNSKVIGSMHLRETASGACEILGFVQDTHWKIAFFYRENDEKMIIIQWNWEVYIYIYVEYDIDVLEYDCDIIRDMICTYNIYIYIQVLSGIIKTRL